MSSSPETPTYTTGAHRARQGARRRVVPRTVAQSPVPPVLAAPEVAYYEPFLDGLFTYCLSVLCDHDAATAALGDVLALAERRGARPDGETRAWLYALARWMCLRTLAEAKQRGRHGHPGGRGEASVPVAASGVPSVSGAPSASDAPLASAAPDRPAPAASHAPLAVPGHHPQGPVGMPRAPFAAPQGPVVLPPAPSGQNDRDGAVWNNWNVGYDASGGEAAPFDDTARARRRELARLAWPEAAGTTPEQREALELAVRHRLTPKEVASVLGLDPAAARELLAAAACEVERTRAALAVVETGSCPIVARLTGDNQVLLGTALRRELVRHVDDCPRCRSAAESAGSSAWPGTAVTPAALPVIAAPRAALHHAMAHARRTVRRARGGGPRFDRRGFPMDPKDHAARRERLRARAVTTTVVATVVAAPVLALWAAYRGAPLTGEGRDGRATGVTEAEDGPGGGGGREDYENAGNARTGSDPRFRGGRGGPGVSVEVISPGGPAGSAPGAGRIGVQARSQGGVTLITLTGAGSSPVRWSASSGASWLVLSQSSGTLSPGGSVTIRVYVDDDREPPGHWSARVTIAPTGAVIALDGYGRPTPPPRPDHQSPRPPQPHPHTPQPPNTTPPPPTPSNDPPTPTTPPPTTPPPPTPTTPPTPTPTPPTD
ncbi:hypothetical protein [Streptomyces sp. NPDC017940]|uniref:BACON domain-containing protein n=1 Tax=Streptomyces sp. NPDC017940 TaxID=3365017 RepID=UPI0037BB7258